MLQSEKAVVEQTKAPLTNWPIGIGNEYHSQKWQWKWKPKQKANNFVVKEVDDEWLADFKESHLNNCVWAYILILTHTNSHNFKISMT